MGTLVQEGTTEMKIKILAVLVVAVALPLIVGGCGSNT
jgi:hypothetical protein